jgi:hypothetical protein
MRARRGGMLHGRSTPALIEAPAGGGVAGAGAAVSLVQLGRIHRTMNYRRRIVTLGPPKESLTGFVPEVRRQACAPAAWSA